MMFSFLTPVDPFLITMHPSRMVGVPCLGLLCYVRCTTLLRPLLTLPLRVGFLGALESGVLTIQIQPMKDLTKGVRGVKEDSLTLLGQALVHVVSFPGAGPDSIDEGMAVQLADLADATLQPEELAPHAATAAHRKRRLAVAAAVERIASAQHSIDLQK